MNFTSGNKDVRIADGVGILSVIEGIRLARSSARYTPRPIPVSSHHPEPVPAVNPPTSETLASFRSFPLAGYAFESDDDLLGPEEFGPIVFRDGIFQIEGISASPGSGLDPKLKELIDSILDPMTGEHQT